MYDEAFYATIREGCKSSAQTVAALLLAHYPAHTVVDVGCGEGWWARAFAEHGCDVLGIDGDYVSASVIPYRAHDLADPLPADIGQFDLAVSLEVAEHLPATRATTFINELCALAPVVMFSAAIPGQGGTGHLNEQWPDYWVDRFAANAYRCSGALRWAIWRDYKVENWYAQNLIVAAADPAGLPGLFDTPLAPVWPVVHPVLWDARRP